MIRSLVVLSLLVSACGGSPKTAPSAAPPPVASATASAAATVTKIEDPGAPDAAPVAESKPEPPKPLAATATFADLVDMLRRAGDAHVAGDCILAGDGTLTTYDASSALGAPPADLDDKLSNAPRGGSLGIKLSTSWGDTEGGGWLDLVALSPVPKAVRSTVTPVFVVTDRGTYFGLLGHAVDPKPLDAASRARVTKEILPKTKVAVVAAEGNATIAQLREALTFATPTDGTVVLATPLKSPGAPGARVSRYDSKVAKGTKYACETDMSRVEGGKTGSYKMATLSKLNDSLHAATKSCGDKLGVGQGGAIHVLLRISPTGALSESCVETDDLGDESVRACVMDAIRKTKLPAPDESKKGTVNFGTEMLYAGKSVRGVCK